VLQKVLQSFYKKGTMETFGEWLRGQRTARKLTREEFAERVGCSVAMLRKIENDERRPSEQIADLMANCLDVPLEERSTFIRAARRELRVDRIRSGSKQVAIPSVLAPKSNLPAFPTPLIGREHEVEQLSQLLCDSQCRLLTLVGPGGIGKTRLAIETASRMQHTFADGVYFVPLASVNSTRFIVPVIADAIGFTFHYAGDADPKTQLLSYLKEKRVLLLIDNLEHLLSTPGIEVLSELLANALKVHLLATSRESLCLQGEWIFEVHGLPVPENLQMEGFAQNTSVELFLQRARRTHVEFNATAESFPAILRICHLVDGTPLAIELAAAWVRTLTCDEIAKEIESSLDFLSIAARDIPARHRSMRAVFDHSWSLLSDEEQSVLSRLSVFQGGFSLAAAEQIAGATVFTLSNLVTKSLIRRSGKDRYDLHELLRQYVKTRAQTNRDDYEATEGRHSAYYLNLVCSLEQPLIGPKQGQLGRSSSKTWRIFAPPGTVPSSMIRSRSSRARSTAFGIFSNPTLRFMKAMQPLDWPQMKLIELAEGFHRWTHLISSSTSICAAARDGAAFIWVNSRKHGAFLMRASKRCVPRVLGRS
jgi:predicted ATPase/transcriptional regulator with XRE-family HTH domain